ncbi:MAG: chromosomal replication initiator protein DnaA [Anaerolineae bacterium]|jgi:chromosomal replication initiator protein|nr:chromosomal replication initiator protein DnaA [Ardenticatenia bacterium]HQZ69734.1 chromosomal replication initiator protein DnaA [Anaerolineae bacterium]HRA20184.1 chromosomal replication initiator protein DnaA [Anaerolineae bacterium]
MDPKALWQAVQTELRSKMSPATYDTWLRPTIGLDISGDSLVIGVPSTYAEDWITQRLNGALTSAIESVVGSPLGYRLVVTPGGGAEDSSLKGNGGQRPLEQARLPDPEASAPTAGQLRLNPRYTFETFVVGPGNRLAHAAAQAVAEFPASHYNPLFIYGGVGLGKTHLLNAIAHGALQRGRKVRMLSSESFTNELINAIRSQSTEAFRQTYRAADVLLLDDIHFIAGKESTQEEFFHTFNAVHGADGQIVVTSDRPPHAIATLEDRLRSRFQWGLLVDVQPPDLETRIAILREKNLRQPQPVSDAVIQLIAQAVQQNVRELEGALNRVVAYTQVNRLPLTAEVAARALEDLMIRRAPPDPQAIIRAVAAFYVLERDELLGPRRSARIVEPRQVAMYLIREETEASYPAIGALFGGRDHTTVLHGCEKIRRLTEQDPKLSSDILQLRQRIYGP